MIFLGFASSPSDVRRTERGAGKGSGPVFSTPAAILGTGRIGTDLTVAPGAVSGTPIPELRFQWRRDGMSIPGATMPLHTVRPEDDLGELSCRVSATNPHGLAVTDTPVVPAHHAPPVAGILSDVALLRGTGNQFVSTSVGFMGENLRFSINTVIGVTIDPQTGMVTVDTIDPLAATSVMVTAKNSGGKDSATFSLKVQDPIVQEPPAFGSQLQILGDPVIGNELALDLKDVSGMPTPTLSYEWRRDGAPISGAESAAYMLQSADDMSAISCRITAFNTAGSAVAETATVTALHLPPQLTTDLADQVFQRDSGIQTIETGAVFSGAALVYSVTGPENVAINAQTGDISVKTDDPLAATSVTVTATNSGGAASADFSLAVHEAPAFAGVPQIEGESVIGGTLSLILPQVTGVPIPVLTHEWCRDGKAIAEAKDTSYTLQSEDDRAAVSCRVTATNVVGNAVAETAPVTATRSAPRTVADLADEVFRQDTGVQTIEAATAFEGEALTFSVAGPAGISIDANTGAVSVPTTEPMASTKITITAANSGGSAQTSLAVTVGQAALAPVLSALEADTDVVPPMVSFQTDQDGIAYWLVNAKSTGSAAEIKVGEGEASGQVIVSEGIVTEDVDLSGVAAGVVRYFHVMVENANGQSNVLTLAFQVQSAQTQWSTDFSEYSAGSPPTDWTATGHTTFALRNVDTGGLVGGNCLRLRVSGAPIAAMLLWDEVPESADVEMLALVTRNGNSTHHSKNLFGPLARHDVVNGNHVGVFATPNTDSSDAVDNYLIRLTEGKHNLPIQGSSSWPDGGQMGLGAAAWLRFRVEGNTIRGKGWIANLGAADLGLSDEPVSWGIDEAQTFVSEAGPVGILAWRWGSSGVTAANTEMRVHYFGVGIDGAAAPKPTFS